MTQRTRATLSTTSILLATVCVVVGLMSALSAPAEASVSSGCASMGSTSVTAAQVSKFKSLAPAAGYTPSEIAYIVKCRLESVAPVQYSSGSAHVAAPTTSNTMVASNTMMPMSTTTACHTWSGTSPVYSSAGNELFSFTVYLGFCVASNLPPLLPGSKIVSHWSAATMTQHIVHHTFSLASTMGWTYSGLDSEGNWGPYFTSTGGVTAQRRAHWHYSFGWGPASITNNSYPWVKFSLSPSGSGTIYWGSNS